MLIIVAVEFCVTQPWKGIFLAGMITRATEMGILTPPCSACVKRLKIKYRLNRSLKAIASMGYAVAKQFDANDFDVIDINQRFT